MEKVRDLEQQCGEVLVRQLVLDGPDDLDSSNLTLVQFGPHVERDGDSETGGTYPHRMKYIVVNNGHYFRYNITPRED